MSGAALGPVLDSLEFDATNADNPFPIHLDGDYYAVVWARSTTSAQLRTGRIASDGSITAIDSWEFSVEDTKFNRIYHISGDLYCISHQYDNAGTNAGHLRTLHISNTGIITKSFDEVYDITYQMDRGFLFQITGSYYAMLYNRGACNHGIWTFTIVGGAGGITLVDSYDFINLCYDMSDAGKVSENMYFAAFTVTDHYRIITLHVSSAGVITTPYVDSQDFTINLSAASLKVYGITSNIFSITLHNTTTGRANIQTIQINNDGTIEVAALDDYGFSESYVGVVMITYTGTEGLYFVVYSGSGDEGFIDVVKINPAGEISDSGDYTAFEYDNVKALEQFPLPTNGIFVPVFYAGPDDDGWVKSITFAPPPVGAHHEMMMKVGP